ncbi:pyrroloquinoline quinone biosynthesis peptide chaperone PqqD [Pseudohongiella spirulinae]|uniref:Coenzyme PQQ synthesis protein D n=1 Tax=Pseudohongiella spirulinae TaxID=1249552 RepID=A0A0S2KGK0_9GAMM|nr:pyrroloquinoline quinone biosynthesis peptide chaperone PqqD [Pseudohongiella spirulinae]ALO47437.1 Coenzyme PQQ synthesis protein D [Pseudohongiella spirulinae]
MSLPISVPLKFARQYKLQWETAQDAWVLLYPEGLIKLTGSAGEILKRIDGRSSVEDIVSNLQAAFPEADLQQDVIDFLEHAHDKGWITAD